MGIGCQQN